VIVSGAANIWLDYHRAHSKENTLRALNFTITKFSPKFGNIKLDEVSSDDIHGFMNQIAEGRKPQTKRIRFSQLTAFFNFVKNNVDPDINNPCDSPMLRQLFRPKTTVHWEVIEKETPYDKNKLVLILRVPNFS
jgi:hypothetical protein